MKKILIAAAMLCAMTASARELTFYIGDTPIENGSTIEFSDFKVETYDDGYRGVTMAPELFVSSDIFTEKVSITAECTSGQTIQLCAGGNCMAGTKVTKNNVTLKTDTKLPLMFDYVNNDIEPGAEVPKVTAVISAQDGDFADTFKSFTIVMAEKAALGNVSVDVTPVEYYNLQGIRIEKPSSGIAIRRQGNKAQTVIIK